MKKIILIAFLSVFFGNIYAQRHVILDPESKEYITEEKFISKYGVDAYDKSMSELKVKYVDEKNFKWRLKASHLVVGTSMIGASFASYAIGNSILEDKIINWSMDENYINQLKDLDNALKGHIISQSVYNKKAAELQEQYGTMEDDVASLNKQRRTLGYICGGVSVVGIIVILTGLYEEYNPNMGYNIIGSTYIDSKDAGVALSFAF